MKKETKTIKKVAPKAVSKKPATKTAATPKSAVKKTKHASECQCKCVEKDEPKHDCGCKAKGKEAKSSCKCENGVCLESLITEIFGYLSDETVLAALMQDYFYTELLKKGIKEADANEYANKIIVNIGSFDANIEIKE